MRHTRTKSVTVTEHFMTCDRCGREMQPNGPDLEYQERLTIRFRGGYCSVFGDGSIVEADFCQHCVQNLLGKWLRITPDDPFEPEHSCSDRDPPKGAYQPYQLPEATEADELRAILRKHFGPLRNGD